MRHVYPLTRETYKVLKADGAVQAFSDAMNFTSTKYTYGILAGTNPDPFAYFIAAYEAARFARIDVTEWQSRIAAVDALYEKSPDLAACLAEKIKGESRTDALIVEAMADGEINDREEESILNSIAHERENLNCIEVGVVHRFESGKVSTAAVDAVRQRPEIQRLNAKKRQ